MRTPTERYWLLGTHIVLLLASLGMAAIMVVVSEDKVGVSKIPFSVLVFIFVLVAIMELILMLDETGNIITDKVNELMADIEGEKSQFGFEEFEEAYEEELEEALEDEIEMAHEVGRERLAFEEAHASP